MADQQQYLDSENSIQSKVFSEQNVLEIEGLIDSYHNLTMKQLEGFKWISKHYPNMKWLVKIDVDTHPNVKLMEEKLGGFAQPWPGLDEGQYSMVASLRLDKVSPRKPEDPAWDVRNYPQKYRKDLPMNAIK